MQPKTKPAPPLSPKDQATHSSNWSEREHVSEQSPLAAQSLVDVAGSLEHAKHAIDVVEQSQCPSPGDDSTVTSPTTIKRNEQFLKAWKN